MSHLAYQMRNLAGAVCIIVAAQNYALAGSVDAKKLGDCLVANETPELINSLRDMMVYGLTDQIPKLREATEKMGGVVVDLSMEKCGLKFKDLQDPGFEKGVGIYGEYAGEKLMNEALSKI